MLVRSVSLAAAVLALSSGFASAHGSHSNEIPSEDWATRHMQGEIGFIWGSLLLSDFHTDSLDRQRSTTSIPSTPVRSLPSTTTTLPGSGQPTKFERHTV